ncbi:Proteophosphoglycan ppg4 [Rhodotorula toruloides ATCC 204091]|nr:Proteophosphoglycan ppg4 [Rhodotorula toruloides ATCC 204091]
MGPLSNPYAGEGGLWVLEPGRGEVRRVEVQWEELQEGRVEFHPLGIEVERTEEGEDKLFVVNHRANQSTIEIFTLSRSSAESNPLAFTATHLTTLSHASFTGAPNSLAAYSDNSFFLSHDHRFNRRFSSLVARLANAVETIFALPLSGVDFVRLDVPRDGGEAKVEVERVLSGIAFANGLALSPTKDTLVVASTTRRQLLFYRIHSSPPSATPKLDLIRTVSLPFLVDNLSLLPSSSSSLAKEGFTILAAGHPSYLALLSAAHRLSFNLRLPSSLASLLDLLGLVKWAEWKVGWDWREQDGGSWGVAVPHPAPSSPQKREREEWETVFKSHGRPKEGGFGGSTTAVIGGGGGGGRWMVVTGLYAEGVRVVRGAEGRERFRKRPCLVAPQQGSLSFLSLSLPPPANLEDAPPLARSDLLAYDPCSSMRGQGGGRSVREDTAGRCTRDEKPSKLTSLDSLVVQHPLLLPRLARRTNLAPPSVLDARLQLPSCSLHSCLAHRRLELALGAIAKVAGRARATAERGGSVPAFALLLLLFPSHSLVLLRSLDQLKRFTTRIPSTLDETHPHRFPRHRPPETTSEEVFEGIVERYLANLGPTKRGKALIDSTLFAFILDTLRDPSDTTLGDSGERYWARAHFEFVRPAGDKDGEVLGPNGDPLVRYFMINQRTRARTAEKPVAQRHEIYEIAKEAHERTNHGGRDKTYNAVKAEWSHIPKELVIGFIKNCPTCCAARTGKASKPHASQAPRLPTSPPRLPTPPPSRQLAPATTLRPRFARPSVDECYDLPTPPDMTALPVDVLPSTSLLAPPPPPAPGKPPISPAPSFLSSAGIALPLPLPPTVSASFDPPRQSPFRPRSLFDPSVNSSASLLDGPSEMLLCSARSSSLTPSLSSSSSSPPTTPSTASASEDGSDDFDPTFWLNDSLFDQAAPVLTCAPSMLLSSFSTPVPQPHFSFAPTVPVQPRGTKRLASPFDDSDCLPADYPSKRSLDAADCTSPPLKRRRVVRAPLV